MEKDVPPKAADREGKLHPVSFRVTPDLRSQLEQSASANGRSLSAEMEHRLSQSFERDRSVARDPSSVFAESSEIKGLCLLIAQIIQEVGAVGVFQSPKAVSDGNTWYNNPYAYDQIVKSIGYTLEAFRPPGADVHPRGPLSEIYSTTGESTAQMWLTELKIGDAILTGHSGLLPEIKENLETMRGRLQERDFGLEFIT